MARSAPVSPRRASTRTRRCAWPRSSTSTRIASPSSVPANGSSRSTLRSRSHHCDAPPDAYRDHMSSAVAPLRDPSSRADERTTLIEFLDYFRTVLLRKADGLTDVQLATPLPPSTLTIGRLVRHMTFV